MSDTKNEKNDYGLETSQSPNYSGDGHDLPKDTAVGEAADLYGNVQLAEEMGYVHRGLKSRHIQFIALGGTIGTGLFLGIGKAFATSGPLSVLLGTSYSKTNGGEIHFLILRQVTLSLVSRSSV